MRGTLESGAPTAGTHKKLEVKETTTRPATSTSPKMLGTGLLSLLVLAPCAIAQDVDYSQFVNPFIGTEGAIPGYACKMPKIFTKLTSD